MIETRPHPKTKHGFDIAFHKGVRRSRALRSVTAAFAEVVIEQEIVSLKEPIGVEVYPIHLISGAPGWHYPLDVDTKREWIHLAGLDPKRAPAWMLRKYPQRLGRGPWPFRFIRGFAHEIAHAMGIDDEDAAWDRGDAILSAALIRCPRLRRRIGAW